MKLYYSGVFNIDLPEGHRFPGAKYKLLRDGLLAEGLVDQACLLPSPIAEPSDVRAAHDIDYVTAVLNGTLDAGEQRRIGLPWSPSLVQRSLTTVGGALASAAMAMQTGFCGQLAGGTHHAHAGFGSGYCVFNDLAVTALTAIRDGWARRVAIVDLDVHQGDGNAAILGGRQDVFILDLYCEKNFPFRKVTPQLPVPLPAGLEDREYLDALAHQLPTVFAFRPDLVLYQAGVDPLIHDALGHLNLSYGGLMERDRLVFEACRDRGVPVSVAIGGGYAKPIEASVTAYVNTFRTAKAVFG